MVDDFARYCDQLMIAEEKIDTTILDGFGSYDMTLYHASPLKLDVIKPNSWNIGNRLTPKKRKSSFWTNNMNYAILWALDWVALRAVGVVKYFHDIQDNKFYVPDGHLIKYDGNGKVKEKIDIIDWMYKMLREQPVYVYQATIPNKLVSRGQYNIDEYTVDVPIKPEKKYTITDKETRGMIATLDRETFFKVYNSEMGCTWKPHPNIRERLIYKNRFSVARKRRKLNESEYEEETPLAAQLEALLIP